MTQKTLQNIHRKPMQEQHMTKMYKTQFEQQLYILVQIYIIYTQYMREVSA